jgi:rubredoxin
MSGRHDGVAGNRRAVPAIGRDSAWLQCPDHCSDPPENVTETRTWMCLICGWIYDEAEGDPDHGIAPGTAWADVPMNWTCPECGARKEDFEMVPV